MQTSSILNPGEIWTRARLKDAFGIRDATIHNGVFAPSGHDSVWIFVTEEKDPDRVQYRDTLRGEELEWEGQLSGRTDRLIIDHETLGLELLLFYRRSRKQYEGAGFQYLGRIRYVKHKGACPTQFTLRLLDRTQAGGAGQGCCFEDLAGFVANSMQMSHIYQPLILRTLLQYGGSATIRALAFALLTADEEVIRYYEDRIRDTPIPVLARHGVVRRDADTVSLCAEGLTAEQRATLEALCTKRLSQYLEDTRKGSLLSLLVEQFERRDDAQS